MKKRNTPLTNQQERLAGRIALAIIRRQARIADYLNRKTAYWDKRSKLIALALFSLAFGGLSLYILLTSLFH
ncbi:MAG TPA: hypothetical protein VIM55_10375 [Mucilaginibacter sp.]